MMHRIDIILSLLVLFISTVPMSCSTGCDSSALQRDLSQYVEDKDANIGIAVVIDGKDTVSVNGDKYFPMLSVYKLPIVLALGDHMRVSDEFVPEVIEVTRDDLHPDTYSPMMEKYAGVDSFSMTLYDVMAYSLQQSDNNASDIILKIAGGAPRVSVALNRLGAGDIRIVSTEDEMHRDSMLCYENSSTPIDMARLIDNFDRDFDDRFSRDVKHLMETCTTGANRLAKPLADTEAVIGHKTGTGFTLPGGRLMAVNDAGYVHTPDGHRYTIVVFVENSGYGMPQTEALIADISAIVWNSMM